MTSRISVVIPCFNAASYLEGAVNSLLRTRYPNLEIIVFDDGSTDGSDRIARKLEEVHAEVRFFRHENGENLGAGRTRNAGVDVATGDYLAFLDADDEVFANRFTSAVDILDSNPDIDAVCGTTQRWIERGGEWRAQYVREQTVFDCEDPDLVLAKRLSGELAWSTNAILLRTAVFRSVGGFSESRFAEDAVLWLKLACVATLVSAGNEPLCVYRIHAGNNSSMAIREDRHVAVNSFVVSEALRWAQDHQVREDKLKLLGEALRGRILDDNRRYRSFGQYRQAISDFVQLTIEHPFLLRETAVRRCGILSVLEACRLKKPAFSPHRSSNGNASGSSVIRARWYDGGNNWGDVLNPKLIEQVSGKTVKRVPWPDPDSRFRRSRPGHLLTSRIVDPLGRYLDSHRPPVYQAIGSTLQQSDRRSVIWGSGYIQGAAHPRCSPRSIHAVRGPLTRDSLLKQGLACPEIYGDPALLMPFLYQPVRNDPEFALGIVPHLCDQQHAYLKRWEGSGGVLLIEIGAGIEEVVDQICRCANIVSSSLHGLIAAGAYGIPNAWIVLSDGVIGNGFKFRDYFASIGVEKEPLFPNEETSVEDLLQHVSRCSAPGHIDLRRLLTACPFADPARVDSLLATASGINDGLMEVW